VLAAVAFFVAAVPALAGAFPAARLTPLVAVVAAPFPPPFTPGFTPRWAPAPPFPPSFADVVTPAFFVTAGADFAGLAALAAAGGADFFTVDFAVFVAMFS